MVSGGAPNWEAEKRSFAGALLGEFSDTQHPRDVANEPADGLDLSAGISASGSCSDLLGTAILIVRVVGNFVGTRTLDGGASFESLKQQRLELLLSFRCC